MFNIFDRTREVKRIKNRTAIIKRKKYNNKPKIEMLSKTNLQLFLQSVKNFKLF